ncbi:MAG: EAL domain-containing response regulator [Pseudorhodoplanes sp.]|jgi:EAL domain-containing protein (putative c-di-GMP-specific phosphodiesterase class I)|nr:EAL domain-containing response regulator [Pseudorhodoplanes sp.]
MANLDAVSRTEQTSTRAYILDDESDVRAFVAQVLRQCGIDPHQFASAASLLAQLKLDIPEILILDLALGQSDAVEVIRHLERLRYRGKVLLISGRDEVTLGEIQQIGRLRGLAMLPPLPKPFRANDLKGRLTAKVELNDVPREDQSVADVAISLSEALSNHWLELWYQPKIDLNKSTICGAEALLRARHPRYGIVLPARFLPPAGDPLYRPLSKFVLERAMADWDYFAQRAVPLRLAVNMPVSIVQTLDFVETVRESLPKDPCFPGLIVEITEDEVIRDPELIQEVAAQLKLYNVAISIDDFGSAYSSLSRLLDFPCVELKLDRGMVSNCSSDRLKRALCQTIVDLAHRVGALVCAEGVENDEDLRALIDMGCDTAQGYFFSKPIDRETFVQAVLGWPDRPKNGSGSGGHHSSKAPHFVMTEKAHRRKPMP